MNENKKKSAGRYIILNKNVYAFLVCIAIASFCWFLIVLSRPYDGTLRFKINYTNLPASKALINQLPDTIDISISTDGYTLLKNSIFGRHQSININCERLTAVADSIYALSSASQLANINRQIGKNYTINKLLPDTFFFNFSTKSKKRVPVKINISYSLDNQYQLSDSITVSPAFVDVFGAADFIKNTEHASTQYLVLNNINKTVTVKLPFVIDNRGVGYSADSVTITIPVDKFTEEEMDVTVSPMSIPDGYSIRIFPEIVKVKYKVAVSNIDKIVPDLFTVTADYNTSTENSNKIKLELTKVPAIVNSVKVIPDKVEFIIRKK